MVHVYYNYYCVNPPESALWSQISQGSSSTALSVSFIYSLLTLFILQSFYKEISKNAQIILAVLCFSEDLNHSVFYSCIDLFINCYWTPHSSQMDHFNSFNETLDDNFISCTSNSHVLSLTNVLLRFNDLLWY